MTAVQLAPGSAAQDVAALARFDGRKLTVSPWFLSGLGIAALGTAAFVGVALTDDAATWDDDGWTVYVGFVMLAILTMIAVNNAALRDHREHTVEQHESLPVGATTRITGLLGATAWPAMVSTLLLGAVASFAAVELGVSAVAIIHVLQNGALVMMLGALGLALAAWMPNSFVAPVAAFVLFAVHPGETPPVWLVAIWPFAAPPSSGLAGWHIVYLLGLTVVLTATAQAKWSRGRPQLIAFIAGSVLVATSLAIILTQACPDGAPCLL